MENLELLFQPNIGDSDPKNELPLRILIIGNFKIDKDDLDLESREPIKINKSGFNKIFQQVMRRYRLTDQIIDFIKIFECAEKNVINATSIKGVIDKLKELKGEYRNQRTFVNALKKILGNKYYNAIEKTAVIISESKWNEMILNEKINAVIERIGKTEFNVNFKRDQPLKLIKVIELAASHFYVEITIPDRFSNENEETKVYIKAEYLKDLEPDAIMRNTRELRVYLNRRLSSETMKLLSLQLDDILHHPKIQALESAWRSVKFLVDRTEYDKNIKTDIFNATKQELIEDFSKTSHKTESALYNIIYKKNYNHFGGIPYSATISTYYFAQDFMAQGHNKYLEQSLKKMYCGPGPRDMFLLENIASVSAMSHVPFIAGVGYEMFGIDSFSKLEKISGDFQKIFETSFYTNWNYFRENLDSRFIGLTVPRFLLRKPYGTEEQSINVFNYKENVDHNHENYLWGNASFAFASVLTSSFSKSKCCFNIIGPKGGGEVFGVQTEVFTPLKLEYDLSNSGFICLNMRKKIDNAVFYSANSVHKPKTFYQDKVAETNYKLGTQFPYIFIINRLAHYIKVIQIENIGSSKSREIIQKKMQKWLTEYISHQGAPKRTIEKKPFLDAKVTLNEIDGNPRYYESIIDITPHFKFMGSPFTLSLNSKLDI